MSTHRATSVIFQSHLLDERKVANVEGAWDFVALPEAEEAGTSEESF